MSRRSSQKSAISLFPFLAVLVCTMGALILLLLVTTRRMHKDQQQATEVAEQWEEFSDPIAETGPDEYIISLDNSRTPPAPEPATEFSIALLPPTSVKDKARIAAKSREADEIRQQLEDERAVHEDLRHEIEIANLELQSTDRSSDTYESQLQQLADLRVEECELEERLNDKKQRLTQLKHELDENSEATEDAEQLRRAQESDLISLRKLAEAAARRSDAGTDATILEFTNSTGTRRSPIVVNVTTDGFEFLPSGVRVPAASLEKTPRRYDPLVAGVLAIHKHRHPNSSGTQPYVFLMVRPDGVPSFYVAKWSLTRADLHFGYDFLEQDRKINSGQADAAETNAVNLAVLNSTNKRFPDYDQYVQLKEAATRELRQQKNQGTAKDPHDITILPDGRMLLPGEELSQEEFPEEDRRFYAGGHAPQSQANPFDIPANFPEQSEGSWAEVTEPSSAPADESPDPFGALTDAAPNPPDPADASTPNPFADAEITAANTDIVSTPWSHGAPFTTSDSEYPSHENSGPTSTLDDETADAFASYFSTLQPDTHETGAKFESYSQLLTRRNGLSHNLGIGGSSATLPAGPNTDSPGHSPGRDAMTTEATSGEQDTEKQDRTSPPAPTGWPDSMTAIHESATRTTGPAGDFSSTNAGSPVNSGSPAQESQGGGSTDGANPTGDGVPTPATGEESFLKQFMRQVEEGRSQGKPDPMLVSMLYKGREMAKTEVAAPEASASSREPDSSAADLFAQLDELTDQKKAATAESTRPPDSAAPTTLPTDADNRYLLFPDGEQPDSTKYTEPVQRGGKRKRVFYVIRIFASRDELLIGDFESVSTKDWSDEQRLALTLEAISATMDDIWANVRKDVAPAVRFLVAPDANDVQAELTKSLSSMNIPTRSAQPQSSSLTIDRFFGDDENVASPESPQPQARMPPAEPVSVRPPETRGTSI